MEPAMVGRALSPKLSFAPVCGCDAGFGFGRLHHLRVPPVMLAASGSENS